MTASVDTAKALFAAYVAQDRAAAERLVAPDFRFTSPLDNGLDRATYFERCWPNSRGVQAFDFIRAVPDGDQVIVTYEAVGKGGKRFCNTEVLTVRGAQITAVEVYFGWNLPHKAAPGGFVDQA